MQGPRGSQGPRGIQGSKGIPGQDGNANVETLIYDTSSKFGITIELDIPQFTQSVIDNDAVLVYILTERGYYLVPGSGLHRAYVTRFLKKVGQGFLHFSN